MTVRVRLFLLLLAVGFIPMSILAWGALDVHQDAVDRTIATMHEQAASGSAALCDSQLSGTRNAFSQLITSTIAWDALSEDEIQGALTLLYRQRPDVVVVSAHGVAPEDSQQIYVADAPNLPSNKRVALPALVEAAAAAARTPGTSAELHRIDENQRPFLSLVFPLANNARFDRIAVTLSLDALCDDVTGHVRGVSTIRLMDREGKPICSTLDSPSPTVQAARDHLGKSFSFSAGNQRWLGAAEELATGWMLLSMQPHDLAFASSKSLRNRSIALVALCLIGIALGGVVLTRSIHRPLSRVTDAARTVAAGQLDVRIGKVGNDEFGELARAFDHMSTEVNRRDTEIRNLNKNLENRVENQTRALTEAQTEILESRKMSAVASLAAGVAHEINNPLTGVLGLVQVLRARAEIDNPSAAKLLASVERESLRIREITQRMLTLAESSQGPGFAIINPTEFVRAAVASIREPAQKGSVRIVERYEAAAATIIGHLTQLQHAAWHVLDNAIKAMPEGGELSVHVDTLDGQLIRLRITDTGIGIAPELQEKIFEPFFTTKTHWRGEGLGLAMVYRIVEAHRGKIKVTSEPGQGTTMTITIPVHRKGAHLA